MTNLNFPIDNTSADEIAKYFSVAVNKVVEAMLEAEFINNTREEKRGLTYQDIHDCMKMIENRETATPSETKKPEKEIIKRPTSKKKNKWGKRYF